MWIAAVAIMLLTLVPSGIVLVRAPTRERLVALELAGTQTVLILLLLAPALNASWALTLALTLALLGVPAALVFTRTLNWWE